MGESMARLLVAEGARVVVADVEDELGRNVADSLGDAAVYAHLDVTDADGWQSTLQAATSAFGVPDVLVNNAGILRIGTVLETDPAVFRQVLDVNLTGAFLGLRTVGAAMVAQRRGSVVNISSTGGLMGYSTLSAYVASKWGLRGLTRTAAIEMGPAGVRVNSVHPGAVATPMTGAEGLDAMLEPPPAGTVDTDPRLVAVDAMSTDQPIARAGRPVELARLVLFLSSDESSYCTGAEFVADGGATAGRDLGGTLDELAGD
jgi:3alpha(or 20beta)-hydroxysteroid dehydrogenase